MVQSDQLTTDIPNHSPNSIATGQQDDFDYQDDREEELYQVDGTTDLHTPTDNSDDNEDNEPDNNACKRKRKTYAPADTLRKQMAKQRQAEVLKKSNKKKREQKLKPKQIKINLTMPIDLDYTSLRVKHPTLIKLKDLKRAAGWLEHMMTIGHQMIPNLTETLKMKIF